MLQIKYKPIFILNGTILLFCLFIKNSYPINQTTAKWSMPITLFETTGRASAAEIIADSSGTLHAFWSYGTSNDVGTNSKDSIYYTRYNEGNWINPVDILVSPGSDVVRTFSVLADKEGFLHIVWSSGGAIFYSQAYAPNASSAQGWQNPLPLTSGSFSVEPAIASNNHGKLYVVWGQANAGLMFIQSQDNGSTWSDPQIIFQADQNNELARWGRIAVDDYGKLHVVLTYTLNTLATDQIRADPYYLFYLQSGDNGKTWSEPWLITPEPNFGEVNIITFGQNIVHLVWNGRIDHSGRYHRWSSDGGQTWSNIDLVMSTEYGGGLTGFPSLIIDGDGTLHVVVNGSLSVYYTSWENGRWTIPTNISNNLNGHGITSKSVSLEQPSIAISEGNLLHVVFHDGFERIWYTTYQLDILHIAGVDLPSLPVSLGLESLPSPIISDDPSNTGSSNIVISNEIQPSKWQNSVIQTQYQVHPLWASIVSVILFIGYVVIWIWKRK